MFTFVERYEFDWPVVVRYPGAQGEAEAEFTARFVLLDEDDLFKGADEETSDIKALIAAERDRLSARLVGWSGIRTESGGELAFSEEARAQLLRQRPIREAVARAYNDAVIRGEVAEKN